MAETLGLTEAARRCNVSSETIRRRIKAGLMPNAVRAGPNGGWTIPLAELVTAGLNPFPGREFAKLSAPQIPSHELELAAAVHRLAELESQLEASRAVLAAKDELVVCLERHLADLRHLAHGLRNEVGE